MTKFRTEKDTVYEIDRANSRVKRPGQEWELFASCSDVVVGEKVAIKTRTMEGHGFGATITTPVVTEILEA